MSKLNEIIVSQLPIQSEVKPCTAYLLDNGDGTHDRYVSDENGNISKQAGGIKTIQAGANITIDNTDPKNPIISSTGGDETDPIFSASPSATITNSDINNWNSKLSAEIDTLESVVNRGNYSSKPISFTGVDNNVGSIWYNASTQSYIFNSSTKQFVGIKNVLMGANTGGMLDTGSSNSIYGNNAGYGLTTGSSNSLFGNAAGQGNQNGSTYMYSTFIGAYAGLKSVNGKYNSFVGYNSGALNTGGDENTFLGSYAGYNNISGFGNLFLGSSSAFIFKYGNSNVVIGHGSGGAKNNDISTPSNRNIYIGRLSGSGVIGDNNVFIGTQAGFVPGSGTTRTVSNKLIIHNRNGFIASENNPTATTNAEDTFNTGLITGDFSERWIKFNGKFIVNSSYMPNAEGDSTYTKNIVAKPDGTFGWTDGLVSDKVRFNLSPSITPTPNTLVPKTDGSGLIWYNNSSIAKNIAIIPSEWSFGFGGVATNDNYDVTIGTRSKQSVTSSSQSVSIGADTIRYGTSYRSNAIGYGALTYGGGSYNNAFGVESIGNSSTSQRCTAIGDNALNCGGTDNIAIGYRAGMPQYVSDKGATSLQNIYLGGLSLTGRVLNDTVNQINIGYNVVGKGSNTIEFGNDNIISTYLKGKIILNERLKLASYTKAQRNALTSKTVGEIIWQTDKGNSGIRVFDGTNWLALQTTID